MVKGNAYIWLCGKDGKFTIMGTRPILYPAWMVITLSGME